MAFTNIRAYFRQRMNALGHKEWTDGFNIENVPDTIFDRAYHIESGLFSGNDQNQTVLDASSSHTIRLFLKGFRDPANAIDQGIQYAQSAVCDIISPVNANGLNLKDVNLESFQVLPYHESNDNSVIVEMNFTVRIFLNTV